MILHILEYSLRNAVLITGLVTVMMMMIESLNIGSKGRFFKAMAGNRVGGVFLGAALGVLPGCLGGFATVSLFSHRMLSFGALVAMMIATAGDESFVMLAAFPKESVWIFSLLFVIAVAAGFITDLFVKKEPGPGCTELSHIHEEDNAEMTDGKRHLGWRRALMFLGVAAFIAALASGLLEHEHEHGVEEAHEHMLGGFNLLDEAWMNILFSVLSLAVLAVIATASDHFVEGHLWHHVVLRHLPKIFAWTFGVIVTLTLALNYLDISSWIGSNTLLMVLLAALVGLIPESGPHLVFVTLYASGIVPLPVLLASCISQDGHAALPLLAEDKAAFLKAKAINCAIAVAVGCCAMLF